MGPPGTAPARVGRRAAGPRCWLPRWVGRVSAPASAGGRVRVAPAHPVPDLRWSCTLARNAQAPCSLDGRRGLRRGGRGPHDRLLRRRPGRLPAGCAPGPDGSQLLAHRPGGRPARRGPCPGGGGSPPLPGRSRDPRTGPSPDPARRLPARGPAVADPGRCVHRPRGRRAPGVPHFANHVFALGVAIQVLVAGAGALLLRWLARAAEALGFCLRRPAAARPAGTIGLPGGPDEPCLRFLCESSRGRAPPPGAPRIAGSSSGG